MAEKGTLNQLISLFGVSGSESKVREFIKAQIKPYVSDVRIDRMGNLIAHKKGKGPKVMLASHMDEIGLMVKRIESRGFVYTTAIGGVDPAAFLGNSVHIITKKARIHGFITTEELLSGKPISKVPTIEDIFVDTGLTKKELATMGVEIGTFVHLDSSPCCPGKKNIILGKALDNRIGCFILLEVARKLRASKSDIYFVFTVQEEFGLWGAKTSAWEIEPDWGIAVDVTHANDAYPEPTRWIGKGPCISIKDGDFISNLCIVDWLKDIAKKHRIPYQLEAAEEGTTDAATMQNVKGGVPSTVLTVPVRNIHTTSGIARMEDVTATVKLLTILLRNPPNVCIV